MAAIVGWSHRVPPCPWVAALVLIHGTAKAEGRSALQTSHRLQRERWDAIFARKKAGWHGVRICEDLSFGPQSGWFILKNLRSHWGLLIWHLAISRTICTAFHPVIPIGVSLSALPPHAGDENQVAITYKDLPKECLEQQASGVRYSQHWLKLIEPPAWTVWILERSNKFQRYPNICKSSPSLSPLVFLFVAWSCPNLKADIGSGGPLGVRVGLLRPVSFYFSLQDVQTGQQILIQDGCLSAACCHTSHEGLPSAQFSMMPWFETTHVLDFPSLFRCKDQSSWRLVW